MPFDIVASDANLAVFAGSDTSKVVLSSLFYYLLCNPEKLERLREEIDRFYPSGESLSSEHFHEMSYLDACINETLRLSPPVPSGSQRDAGPDTTPSKGRTFGSQCVFHHCESLDTDNWDSVIFQRERPSRFIPSRFTRILGTSAHSQTSSGQNDGSLSKMQ